jgi:putative cardiolipin synthase
MQRVSADRSLVGPLGFWLLVAASALSGCSNFPARPDYDDSLALPSAESGELSALRRDIDAELDDDESAWWLIEESAEALDVRLAMFDEAVSSLDVQYFIWEPDATGRLLMRRLIQAADRGVKVRLLMDDITTTRRDYEFTALDSHPNVEVRYFNPWKFRSRLGRLVELFMRFGVLNHRLHNKTIIADGHFGLIGGRNLGDRYFGLYEVFVQNDLDILFSGPIVDRVEEDFDLYWNSRETYRIDGYLKVKRNDPSLSDFSAFLDEVVEDSRERLQLFPLQPGSWTELIDRLKRTYAGGTAEYLYDLPSVREMPPTQLYDQFKELIDRAQTELILSTAYFVPDAEFVDQLARIASRGVRVVALTNSLQTNNHTLAHTAYKRWRDDLLRAGVELYELRPDADILDDYVVEPIDSGFLGLHSKAVIIDRRWAFVGTPNVDPRAMILNTENGLAVDSEMLAEELRDLILEATAPENSWRIEFDAREKIIWVGPDGTLERQPASGFGQRLKEFFVNLLPLKKQA